MFALSLTSRRWPGLDASFAFEAPAVALDQLATGSIRKPWCSLNGGNMIERLLTAVAASLLLQVGTAAAYCSEPSPPSRYSKPERPEAPDRPYCAAMQNCSQWEIDRYNSELRTYKSELAAYQDEIETYVRKLKAYVDDAVEYAQCEVRSISD